MTSAVGYDIDAKRATKAVTSVARHAPETARKGADSAAWLAWKLTGLRSRDCLGVVRDPTVAPCFTLDDEHWMRAALAEARAAAAHGDVPVGCDRRDRTASAGSAGTIVARSDSDPTAHAEIVALARGARPRAATGGSTGAPSSSRSSPVRCAPARSSMRASHASYSARADPKAGAVATLFQIGQDARLNHRFQLEAGVLATESVALLQSFFAALRARGEK